MDAPTAIMLVLLVVLVFFIFRNRRKRQRDQANLQTKMVPGVEIMLTFGIYGTLVSIDDENNVAEVEIAPGTIIKVHRQTLGRVVEPVADVDSVTDGSDVVVEPAESTGTAAPYSLNKDNAIPAESPEFGERLDSKTTRSRESDNDKS
jgi:preprotein translocase subunit YajC